jgi:LAO/AO transport system kinase
VTDPAPVIPELVEGVLAGRTRAVARAISIVEEGSTRRDDLMRELDSATGGVTPPRIIGITGPPGAGKSTLIGSLIMAARQAGERVAVLAFDPSSPFSGGALLGDRLRMTRHTGDAAVFVRSMATRGHGGGLSAAALEASTILAAAGFGTILVESVGVGQTEIGILAIADIVTVILNPGTGDEIQTLKAGVMEIGDLYVVNKADLAGADDLERSLLRAGLVSPGTDLPPVILRTVAEDGTGVDELYRAMRERIGALAERGELELRRRQSLAAALEQLAGDLFRRWVHDNHIVNGTGQVPFGELRQRLAGILESLGTGGTE